MMKHKIAAALCGAMAAGILLSACGAKSSAAVSFNAAGSSRSQEKLATADYAMDDAFLMEEAEASMEEAGTASGLTAIERKLIRTGNIRLEVDSLADTRTAINGWLAAYKGYISDSYERADRLSVTVRIPSSSFDAAMNDALGFGKVRSKTVGSQDVTDQYYDLEKRLSAKKLMQERLEQYLKSAKDIKDMLEIETKLNEVTTELEVLQGRMNRLASQVDYSTISIEAVLPVNQTEDGFVLPDTKSAFRRLGGNIVSFFVGLFFAILYIVIFGTPLVLALGLLYWICFGKVGLVRRLFAWLGAKKRQQ